MSEANALIIDMSNEDHNGDCICVKDAVGEVVENLTRLELIADAAEGTDGRLALPTLRLFALNRGTWPPPGVPEGETRLTLELTVNVEVVPVGFTYRVTLQR